MYITLWGLALGFLFVASAIADVTPHVLNQNPELREIDAEGIKDLYRIQFGTGFPYELEEDRDVRFQDIQLQTYACTVPTTDDHGHDRVEDCRVRVLRDTMKNMVLLVKFDLPKVAPEQKYFKSAPLAISYTQLIAVNQLNANVTFLRTVWIAGALAHQFAAENSEGQYVLFVDAHSGKILDQRWRQKIHRLKATLYPVYENPSDPNPATGERLQVKLEPRAVDIGPLTWSGPWSTMNGLAHVAGTYCQSKEIGANPEMAGTPGAWDAEELEAKLENLPTEPRERSAPENQVLLDGEFVTILVNPESAAGLPAPVRYMNKFHETYLRHGDDSCRVVGASALYPALSTKDTYDSPSTISPADWEKLLADPFDALHVFHGSTTFFRRMRELGYTDFKAADLKVRAYLYDREIFNKDNAFYTDGTINFTTYTANAVNFARDNTVIWHELGHAVFDKIVEAGGWPNVQKGDGINEGLSDFMSHLVFLAEGNKEHYPGYRHNRIYSDMMFNLSNESHDDGEAFGGTLREVLEAKMLTSPALAVAQTTDLVLSTMRLLSGSLNMTEQEFFHTLLIADSRGSKIRAPYEFKAFIERALERRNFAWVTDEQASLTMTVNDEEISTASAYRPHYTFIENSGAESVYKVEVKLTDGQQQALPQRLDVTLVANSTARSPILMTVTGESSLTNVSPSDVFQWQVRVPHSCQTYNARNKSCRGSFQIELKSAGRKSVLARRRVRFAINQPHYQR